MLLIYYLGIVILVLNKVPLTLTLYTHTNIARLKNIADKECKPFDFILMLGMGFRYTVCKIAFGGDNH